MTLLTAYIVSIVLSFFLCIYFIWATGEDITIGHIALMFASALIPFWNGAMTLCLMVEHYANGIENFFKNRIVTFFETVIFKGKCK